MTYPVANPPKRRTFLQRTLLVVGGALGLTTLARRSTPEAPQAPVAAPPAARTLTLHGRRRWPSPDGRLPGAPARERLIRQGEILDGAGGAAVGEFCSSGFYREGPFGPHPTGGANLEFQTFRLGDGTLFGIGAATPGRGQRAFAILGGTGRFAGAQGSYVEHDAGDPARPGAVVFEVKFV